MSSQYIYTMHKVTRRFPPDKTVLNEVSLSFFPGAKIGVLGYNGAGKSTVLRIMAGLDHDYTGEAKLAPGATVGMLSQEPDLDEAKDVRGNVEDGVGEVRDLMARFNELSMNYSDETADEFARLQDQIDAADGWNLDTLIDTAMDALRLPPADADVTTLSGGERRRVALCRLLLSAPDLLLLDEPTNHLDAESVAWLEQHLNDYKGAIVAAGCPTRATTPRGSSRSRSAWRWRRRATRSARRRSTPSSTGCARTPRGGARRPRRG